MDEQHRTNRGDQRESDPIADARARAAHELHEGTKLEAVLTILKPAEELFAFWRDFTNLPRFMHHLKRVDIESPVRTHWVWETIGGVTIEWDTEIIAEIQDRMISWQTLPDSSVHQAGSVWFRPAPQDQATEVHVQLMYAIPAGRIAPKAVQKLAQKFAQLFGEDPARTLREDLRRLRSLMEAGEVPTTDGQSRGALH